MDGVEVCPEIYVKDAQLTVHTCKNNCVDDFFVGSRTLVDNS